MVATAIKKRPVQGHFNPMAVCDRCNRDATQTRITRYCDAVITGQPLVCDSCVDIAEAA